MRLKRTKQLTLRIKASAFVALFCCLQVMGAASELKQQNTASGIILDENGLGLPGVSIVEKGTSNGVVTNFEGHFEISLKNPDAVLVLSYLGYKTQEIPGKENMTISLIPETQTLEDVVVVGYGTESKANQTSSVVAIKTAEINTIPTAQMSTSLAGRLPGVQIVQNSGFVGGSADITVRGGGTPLYVIDNVVSDKSQFDVLDPSEVESISILKDAASASIYGARAAGGVVIVKTKSGKFSEKVTVNYRNIFTVSQTTNPMQDWTPYQELLWRNQVAYSNNRITPDSNFKVPFDEAALEYSKTIKSQTPGGYLWRTPFSQQHSLNVSGGSQKIRYFFGANYNQNKGSYDKTNFSKYTLRAKVDAEITKNFSIGTNINFNRRDTDRFFWPYDNDKGEGFTVEDFYRPTFDLSRLYPFYQKANGEWTTPGDPEGFPVIQPGWGYNPVETIKSSNYRKILYNTFNAIVDVTYKIPKVDGLSLKFLGDYRQDNYFAKDFIGEFNRSYRTQTVGNTGIDLLRPAPLKFDKNNTVVNNLGRSFTGIEEGFRLEERYQLNGFIEYKRTFNNLHDVEAFAGYEQFQYNTKSGIGSANQSITPKNDQIIGTNSATERRYFDGGESYQARVSYMGRAKYAYAGKYIFGASLRGDGSFIFPKGKRFGFFPSFSGAWVISKENFFAENIPFVNSLKLRMSYGTTGDDGNIGTDLYITPFQYQNNYNVNGFYLFNLESVTALSPQGVVANPDITWSVNKTFNYGIDAGLFGNSWTFSLDYFVTDRVNLLASTGAQVPGTFGSNLPSKNVGESKVYGFEFVTNYANHIGEFEYSVGLNIGYAMQKYVKWPQAANIADFQNNIGLPMVGVVRGYISEGIIKDQTLVDELNKKGFTQFGRTIVLGSVFIKDINGDGYKPGADGKVDTNDQTIISKNAIPRINFGVPLDFKWRNFSLNLFFQGVGPYDKFVTTMNTKDSGGAFQVSSRPYFQLWTDAYSPEYNPNGKYPAAFGRWVNPDHTGSSTTFWKYNGAYIRLKNLNFAYTIPKKFTKVIGIQNCQLNFNATNLFTLSAFNLYDPEQEQLDSYPIFRTYSLGINVSF